MRKSNYALITALYFKNKGLYTDIYFPIIRYAILKIFSGRQEEHPYSSASDISDFIKNKFGISMPTLVIVATIKKIYNNDKGSIKLKVFERGNTFQIMQVYNDDSENIDWQEKEFKEKEEEIETKFKKYINTEGIYNDDVTFVKFISSNTDDLLAYFESENEKAVDEKYFSLVSFLRQLHKTEEELYQIANKFFWASIIAAFLQSNKPSVNASENNTKIEYFLDTPLVLGILKLSTPEKEQSSEEILNLIRSSQGIIRVHPLTIEEIRKIIHSGEKEGINPFSDIAAAKESHHLNETDFARIRINIEKEIESAGINICPISSTVDSDKIRRQYSGTEKVMALAKHRSKGIESYTKDGFREIHDIFMDDYIKSRRKEKEDDKHIFFVTNNMDLVNLCKDFHAGENYMISTSRLVLELWMYNNKATDISDCALVEAMAQCIDTHKSNVKSKLAIVSKYYNQSQGNFDEKLYNDFIRQLYRRARNVISFVDSSKDFESKDYLSWSANLKKAVSADNDIEAATRQKIEREKAELQETIKNKDQELKDTEIKQDKLEQNVQSLQRENKSLIEVNKKLGDDNKGLTEKVDKLTNTISALKLRMQYATKLNELKKQKELDESDLEIWKKKRKDSYTNCALYGFILLLIVAVTMAILNICKVIVMPLIGYIATWGPSFLTAVVALYNNTEKRKENAYKKWENKPENKKYSILKDKVKEDINEIENINKKIKALEIM